MQNVQALLMLVALSVLLMCLITCRSAERSSTSTVSKEEPQTMSVKDDVKTTPESKSMREEMPFACNMLALTPEGRERHLTVIKALMASKRAVEEMSDGYAFRFDSGEQSIMLAAEFIFRERLCCPFFTFELVSEPEGGQLWLRLKGREGVKAFIREEFKLDG